GRVHALRQAIDCRHRPVTPAAGRRGGGQPASDFTIDHCVQQRGAVRALAMGRAGKMKLAAILGLRAAGLMALTSQVRAQGAYPNDSVKIIVPFGAGSVTDTLARTLGDRLTAVWKQTVVVENRPGLPGTTSAARAQPDGYTLMVTSNGHVI